MALVLFLAALGLITARLALLACIYTGKLPRQTVNARSQVILVLDMYATYNIGSTLADATHSAWASTFTWLFCMSYLFTIAVRFPMEYGKQYRPQVMELTIYAGAQVILLLAYVLAVWA